MHYPGWIKLSFSITVRSRGSAVKPSKTLPSFIGFRSLRSELSLLSRTALVIILAGLCLLILTSYAYPAQVTLIWDPVTHPDLAGYKIYYGNSSRNYVVSTEVGNQTSCTITDLIDTEPYYFAATAYDIYRNGSDYSNEVSYSSANNSPVLNPIGTKTTVEGQLLQFTVSATDPDGDALSYSVNYFPAGANFDSATRTFWWTPTEGDVGDYSVLFTVTDTGTPPLSASETALIIVGNMDALPAAPKNLTLSKP